MTSDEYKDHHDGAIFTVELGCLISNGFDVGMKTYPIFDENYRSELNQKIVDHYWFREIGLETPALFKRFLNRKMNEIMPYYNQMYTSTLLTFDPLSNYELKTNGANTSTRKDARNTAHTEGVTSDANSTNTSTSDGTSRTLVSQTPQMQLSGREDYASNITDTASKSSADGSAAQHSDEHRSLNEDESVDSTSKDDYITTVSGLSGITSSDALLQFRSTFLNIDMLVIEELQELFMGIYTDYWDAL